MDQREQLFNDIYEVKYTAIYGNMCARRYSRFNCALEIAIGFLTSGVFCSFWIWEGHAKLLSAAMLLMAFVQMAFHHLDLNGAAARIRTAVRELNELYDDALAKWRSLEADSAPDADYGQYSGELRLRESKIVAPANDSVFSSNAIYKAADALARSHVRFDFNL